MKLLHISDTHFGTERDNVTEALLRLHRQLAPEVVVLSGDVTQRATRVQFAAARRFVDRLQGSMLLAVPGNHDVPLFNLLARFTTPLRRFRHCFGADIEPILDTPDLLLIGVNTVRPHWHKDGSVSAEQIQRVASRLRLAGSRQLRVVITHHPLEVTRAIDEPNRARHADEAIRAWLNAGADLLLGGHIHLPYLLALGSRYPEIGRDAWVLQAGTAVSQRVRGPVSNSVNLIVHAERAYENDQNGGNTCSTCDGARRCLVQRWDFDEERIEFMKVSEARLAFDRGRPLADRRPGQASDSARVFLT